jgi:hypothetical protein
MGQSQKNLYNVLKYYTKNISCDNSQSQEKFHERTAKFYKNRGQTEYPF